MLELDNDYAQLLQSKIDKAKELLVEVLQEKGPEATHLCWTGGKDSTLALWLAREACKENGLPVPACVVIDDGDTFPEIETFITQLTNDWSLDVRTLRNNDLLADDVRVGDWIPVVGLNKANQAALLEIGFQDEELEYAPESFECTHLLKSLVLREHVVDQGVRALCIAIRRDEHESRQNETYRAQVDEPAYLRIHPLLDFEERDVWACILSREIPYCPLYAEGYRSLGAKSGTSPVLPGVPAWEQDFSEYPERYGRGQFKEQLMLKLRSLGYM